MQYAFIGGGNMGRALAAALVGKGVCLAGEILVVDPDEAARERNASLGCEVREQPDDHLSEASVVVLAVKPQTAPDMYGQVRPHLRSKQVVVSIMA